ncbi:MAG: hypothetical protein WD874_01550 [Parcubacteria group bacterium]
MRNLGDLITRIRESLKDDVYIREVAASTIFEVTKAKVLSDQLSLKDGVLNINVSPALKSEIFLREERVLQGFKEKKLPIRGIVYR